MIHSFRNTRSSRLTALISRRNYIVITTIVLMMFLTTSCKENDQRQAKSLPSNETRTVGVHTVSESSVRSQVDIMGTVESTEKAIIAARINGHIIELNATLGSKVQTGEKLIQISAEEISAQLLQSSAQLNQAERNLKREQKLLSKNATTTEGVKSQEDVYKIALASHKEAQSMLSYTGIRAPFDGIITKKLVSVGDLATPGKPLLHLENDKTLQILTDIPEALILPISLGDKIEVSVPAAGVTISGEISEIAPATDPLTRTTTVKISLPTSKNLRSGQFARVHLSQTQVKTILVPQESISHYGQMEKVFLFENNTARLRLIKTGKKEKGKVEIISGLTNGDILILPGKQKIKDGQSVRIRQ